MQIGGVQIIPRGALLGFQLFQLVSYAVTQWRRLARSTIVNDEIREVPKRAAKAKDDPVKWVAWVEKRFKAQRGYTAKVLQPLGESFKVDAWRIETMVDRIANTGVLGLKDGVPEGWEQGRRLEVAAIIDECLCAGVMRDAA